MLVGGPEVGTMVGAGDILSPWEGGLLGLKVGLSVGFPVGFG